MGLSEDSRTLLQLLLGRGKSYGDIAGLLGIEESEVRDRAHKALTEINGGDPDKDLNLTDYLLGQSDPIDRAEVARELADNPKAAETAAELSDQLRLLVPGAALPRIQGGKVTPSRRGSPASGSGPATQGESTASESSRPLTGSQRRLIAILLGAALLVTVVILALTGAFSGDDDSKDPADVGKGQFAGALLQPTGNQDGSGRVQLGRVDQSFAANLQFDGLEPTSKKESYVLWMDGSRGSFPLSEFAIGKDGTYSSTVTLLPEALCSMAAGIFTDLSVSRLNQAQSKAVVADTQKALKGSQKSLPALAGKESYSGPIALPEDLRANITQQCETPATQSE